MRILVDSCVWSAVLRRGSLASDPVRIEMVRLIEEGCVELIGPVRQEILSGVRTQSQFDSLREALELFPEINIRSQDFVEAARLYNLCRSRGIQGSGTDFVICAGGNGVRSVHLTNRWGAQKRCESTAPDRGIAS